MIIGQELLCKKIESLELDNFPRSLILVGDHGSGKHLVIRFIQQHLNLPCEFLSSVSFEIINNIQLGTTPCLYVVESADLKMQNQILKFLEEPTATAFVILLCNNIDYYIPTICGRCQIWYLSKYTDEILRQFCGEYESSELLQFAKTPGDIEILSNNNNFYTWLDLSKKIFDKIGNATYGNLFNISNKFIDAVDNEFELFVRVLLYVIVSRIETDPLNTFNRRAYELTDRLINDFQVPHLNRQHCFENYLFRLKKAHEYTRC